MRTCFLVVLAVALSAAAPSTRPSPEQYFLQVRRYADNVVVATSKLSTIVGRPFAYHIHAGSYTLAIDGTVQPTGRHGDVRLHITYDELDTDSRRRVCRKVTSTLEPDLGHEQNLSQSVAGTHEERLAVTVTAVALP